MKLAASKVGFVHHDDVKHIVGGVAAMKLVDALPNFFPEALLFVERWTFEWDNTAVHMRVPLKYAAGLKLHQACGAFLHYLREYEQMVSASDALAARKDLYQMFLRGFMDPDLHHSLDNSVPPGRIEDIASFRLAHFQVFF